MRLIRQTWAAPGVSKVLSQPASMRHIWFWPYVWKPPAITVHQAWRRTTSGVIGPCGYSGPSSYAPSPRTTGFRGVRSESDTTAG